MNRWRTGAVDLAMLIIAVSITQGCAAAQRQLTLVDHGEAVATIVIAADAAKAADPAKPDALPSNALAAADEFQQYIERITGAKLPIVTDAEADAVKGPLVLIGRSKLTDAIAGLDIPTGCTPNLQDEGLVIRCDGERLVLAGNDTPPYLGTRYAVVQMLRRLGVRWFMPGEFGEVVPRRDTITVGPLNVTEHPDFAIRDYWEHGKDRMIADLREWKIHNLMNPDIKMWYGVPGDGSVSGVLPQDQFDEHPEWFALRADGSRNGNMPCMTSRPMIHAVAQKLIGMAKAGARSAAFAPEDGQPRCEDPGCKAMSTGFDGTWSTPRHPQPGLSTTQEWMYFTSQVLKEVHTQYPDFVLVTNGYATRCIAPEIDRDVQIPADKMIMMFANIFNCTIHSYADRDCWQQQREAQMVRQWRSQSTRVFRYGYNYTMMDTCGMFTPMVHLERVNIPLLKQWGLWGFWDQDTCDWSYSGLTTRFVRARLEWDADANVDALLDDFFAKWYGRAADPMRSYYDAVEHAFATSKEHGGQDFMLASIYTPQLVERLGGMIADAEHLAATPTEKLHVKVDRLIYDYTRQFVASEQAQLNCDYDTAVQAATRMVEIKSELHQISPFFGWEPYQSQASKRLPFTLILRSMTAGPASELLAKLPLKAKFQTDPHDDGLFERWCDEAFDDSTWPTLTTATGWQNQGHGLRNETGHPYLGLAWYRLNVKVPESAPGREVRLCVPQSIDEAWVWVNGKYAGHRVAGHPTMPKKWWLRPKIFDVDVTGLLRPGQVNQITLRVRCDVERYGTCGIHSRMFLYSADPNPIARLNAQGQAPPPTIERATPPTDGELTTVTIAAVDGAEIYQLWVSDHPDGRGARMAFSDTSRSLTLEDYPIYGRAYLFAAYIDAQGRQSKASAPEMFEREPSPPAQTSAP